MFYKSLMNAGELFAFADTGTSVFVAKTGYCQCT